MRVQVRKWGNSASVRIPASVLAAASLKIDQTVDIREEEGRIVIEHVELPVFDLSSLLDRMTADTFPGETDFGRPAGQEIW